MPKCIVCNTPNATRQPGAGDFARFGRPRCGSFALSGSAESALDGLLAEIPLRRSLMSHTLRRMQRPDQKHLRIIESKNEWPTFWREERLPSPLEQAVHAAAGRFTPRGNQQLIEPQRQLNENKTSHCIGDNLCCGFTADSLRRRK